MRPPSSFLSCRCKERFVIDHVVDKDHVGEIDHRHSHHCYSNGDQNIHHKFLAMGFTPRNSLILIQAISTAFIVGTVLGSFFGVDINIIFWADVLVWTALNVWFSKIINKKNS